MKKIDNQYKNKEFKDVLKISLGTICPKHCNTSSLDLRKQEIENLENIFNEMEHIYSKKEEHNLHWAFKNTQKEFNKLFTEQIEKHLQPEVSSLKCCNKNKENKKKLAEELAKFLGLNRRRRLYIRKKSQLFSALSFFVSMVDVILSIFLVVTISKLGHFGESLINSALLYLFLIALFKVTLEKFWLIPLVDRWGWKLYKEALDRFKYNLSVLMAISIAIKVSEKDNLNPKEVISLCESGIKKMII